MCFNKFEIIIKPCFHYLFQFLSRISHPSPGVQLRSLALFRRSLQTQGNIVSNVIAADGKDFKRNQIVVFEDDNRESLGADISQETSNPLLFFGKGNTT